MITIPRYLSPGDTIGLVCPAGYMDAEKVQCCINTLKDWGFRVKIGNTVGSASSRPLMPVLIALRDPTAITEH